jgi:hypothetical protein
MDRNSMTAAPYSDSTPAPPRLSRSRFRSGLQCHKRLWLEVHEPDALELQLSPGIRFRTQQRLAVVTQARTHFAGGVLVDPPHATRAERVAATARPIADRSPAVFAAAFQAEGVYCTVDVLERASGGWALIEVKAATSVTDEHIADVALQVWVARRCGLEIERVEVMHLNGECRYPDLSELYIREDVTGRVEAFLPQVPALVSAQLATLVGPEPVLPIGPHCGEPGDCPFEGRCWRDVPPDHVTMLHGIRRLNAWGLVQGWRERMGDLPPDLPLTPLQQRQRRAQLEGRMLVEPGLGDALRALVPPIAHLDFETVGPAIPVWPGLGPWHVAPVQFSCHVQRLDGTLEHHQWLAVGPEDPRPELARALIEACGEARTITMYTGSERAMIRQLAAAAPDLATELAGLDARLVDLKAILSRNVCHPGFRGSLGLKQVLPVLVPGLTFDLLPIRDGVRASAELYRLLFDSAGLLPTERATLEMELLAYCELDTLAMVRLTECLRALAA